MGSLAASRATRSEEIEWAAGGRFGKVNHAMDQSDIQDVLYVDENNKFIMMLWNWKNI
jgi:hypothetical protein